MGNDLDMTPSPDAGSGHVVVPVEPTDEMLNAGYDWDDHVTGTETHPRNRGLYRAMLSAAPPVQMEAVAWRWRVASGSTWVHCSREPKTGCVFTDDTIVGRDVIVQPLYASPVPSSERDDIIEMCAKVAKRYALMAERRSQEYLADSPALAAALDKFEAATEIEAEILSLKSQPAQEAG